MNTRLKEIISNTFYLFILAAAKSYWRIFRPKTLRARVLLVCNGKVLLVQPRLSTYWEFPGGGMKKNEDPGIAALRELYEETGINDAVVNHQLGTYTSDYGGKRDTVHVVVATVSGFTIPNQEIEIQKAEWFSLEGLPEKTIKTAIWCIEEYRKGSRGIQARFTNQGMDMS